MCKVGLPAMLEQAIMRVGMIIFSRTIASLGEVSMATHQICMNIQSLSMMNGQALAVSATTLIGQSLGRKRPIWQNITAANAVQSHSGSLYA